MGEQKFKRGNLVKVLVGHRIWNNKTGIHDIAPNDIGRKAIIDYSYADKYGGGNIDSYSITWLDTGGRRSWKRTNELELLGEGGEHLFEEAKANKNKITWMNFVNSPKIQQEFGWDAYFKMREAEYEDWTKNGEQIGSE